MDIFLPVLFISLLAVTIFIFFAFFPIRVSWFYYSGEDNKAHKTKNKTSNKTVKVYDFSDEYKNYRQKDEDSFDDPEL